jgi:hypothetical protein
MLEEHVFNLLPGYTLGCLDEDDLLTVARHLPHCAACRNDLATYWAAADQLALAAPARIPPPDLKAKILRKVESASTPVEQPLPVIPAPPVRQAAPARPTGGVLAVFRRLWARPVGLALGVLALLLVIFMGVSNLLLWQRVNDLQARAPRENMQLVYMEGTQNAPLAQGYLMVFKNETYGTLVVDNAPRLEPGHEYQLWLIRDGKRTSGGVFSVSEDGYGTLEVVSSQPLETYPSFGITIEPTGGSPAPTGKKVLGGSF